LLLYLKNKTGITFKLKHTLKNADFPSAIRPIPRSEGCLHQSLWIIF